MTPTPNLAQASALRRAPLNRDNVLDFLTVVITQLRFGTDRKIRLASSSQAAVDALAGCVGDTLQERWCSFEQTVWPKWVAGRDRPRCRWRWGARLMVISRLVLPSWEWMSKLRVQQLITCLPEEDPLVQERARLAKVVEQLSWVTPEGRAVAISCGLRILLALGYGSLSQVTERDLSTIPSSVLGTDTLDAALCFMGVFARTPQRGPTRRLRRGRPTVADVVAKADIPERFQAVTKLYLETYTARISDLYATQRHKVNALGHFWRFLAQRYPEITSSSDVLPAHARAYIPFAIERARERRRDGDSEETNVRTIVHTRLVHVRAFFSDVCTWASEPGSPFAVLAPRTIPLTRYDLVGVGFDKARKQVQKRLVATVLDLEREMPNIRAFAFRKWHEAEAALKAEETDARLRTTEFDAFWDWGLLELLVQSGLRLEEASELTTLDILKRHMPDGRVYYMLHVKPSKYDRARVIPIGDGLGRVIAEMIRHVKSFNGTTEVPFCDHWDHHEKRPLPRAPYLVRAPQTPKSARHAGNSPPAAAGVGRRRCKEDQMARRSACIHTIAAAYLLPSISTTIRRFM